MRLIDADKIDFTKAFGGYSAFGKDLISAAQELIDIQQTAFDKKKVLEELEHNMNIAKEEYRESGRHWENPELFLGKIEAYEIAIATVKKGGVG